MMIYIPVMSFILDRKLEIFRMAATLSHFSEAAAALGMTQPNVTQQIALLEKELGTPLFDRVGRRIELTPAGRTLLEECGRLFVETGEIRRRVMNAAGGVRYYRIGGTMTAGGHILPELVAGYMNRNPLHNIGIHVANTAEISGLLKSRGLDLALVEGPFDQEIFLSSKLLSDEMVPVSAPGVVPAEFSLRNYMKKGGRFVLRESGSGTLYHFDRFIRTLGLPPIKKDNVIVANNFDAIKHLVSGGYGITVISRLAVESEIASGSLKASRFSEGKILRDIHFIYLANENLKFAERFIAFCKTVMTSGANSGSRKNSGKK